ncbi:hypothetical protein LPB140_09185 [Sphingorhabdus lutea]|uniref:OmpH family outer membrane protein n=1 Tax=Sphingorhabdus lutea TaxID=1913578 RepID=A0A1L3JCT9_9SPHN|nr:OmpH family outer membrane protein [Sphingorhabdus lutea]APG62932.1 hypothetical protein LPB140_09185 [Sphingorhabdus lutea]
MIKSMKNILMAATASALFIAPAAQAQVAGIATADVTTSIVKAKGFGAAYEQVQNTFSANSGLIQGKLKEINDINAQLDTDGNKELTQAELDAAIKAKNPLLTQLQQKEDEINQLEAPAIRARVYIIEQYLQQYAAAQQSVVTAKKINFILAPDAFLWAPEAIDISPAITAELDKLVPTASITPPAEWQPSRQGYGIYEQIQQLLTNVARQRAAQAAAQQNAPAANAAQPESR